MNKMLKNLTPTVAPYPSIIVEHPTTSALEELMQTVLILQIAA